MPNLIVNGTLRVRGTLTAKHIQGKGAIRGENIRFETMQIGLVDAEQLSGRELLADQVLCSACYVSDRIIAKDYIQAYELETDSLACCLSSLKSCKAEQIIVLKSKKRGVLRLAAAAWLQTVRGKLAWKRQQSQGRRGKQADPAPDLAVIQQVLDYLEKSRLSGQPEISGEERRAA